MSRGFFAVGIEGGKNSVNVGTLWRSANIMGAAFIFTVGRRYKRQPSDTMESWRHIPLFHFDTIDDLKSHAPHDCLLVGVELDDNAIPAHRFAHPERAIYLLGAEDHGLSATALKACQKLVVLPGDHCLNVSVAGSLILYDRHMKSTPTEATP